MTASTNHATIVQAWVDVIVADERRKRNVRKCEFSFHSGNAFVFEQFESLLARNVASVEAAQEVFRAEMSKVDEAVRGDVMVAVMTEADKIAKSRDAQIVAELSARRIKRAA